MVALIRFGASHRFTATTQVIRESTCIAPTTSCWLTIVDLEGDGLLAEHSSNGFAGWFALIHGAETVAVYSNEPSAEFETLQYCIGPACDEPPQQVDGSLNSSGGGECETVFLSLQLDARPQDTSYTLHCDGKTVWMKQWFTEPGGYIEDEHCVAPTSCCTFMIKDGVTQGLTTAHQGQPGFVYLEWNYEGLMEYDGVAGEEFDFESVQFGHGCREPWQDEVDFPVEDVNDSANYGGHGPVYGRPVDEIELFDEQVVTKGISDTAKIILFVLAGLTLCCCLVVAFFYRRALVHDREHDELKDVPAGSTAGKVGLASKDAHAEPDIPHGATMDDDSDADSDSPAFI
ncbi:MAG: hypothetical protein SGARI_006554 [Bacillariaceae sp.]